jgi:DNA-binding NtrC family response regulator
MVHILLIDDDYNFRRSLVIQFELEGFEVTEIQDAMEAFEYLTRCESNRNFPDIVITDVKMPKLKGEQFVPNLSSKYPGLPVIVISAFDLPQELAGYPFLRKPFKLHQMLEIINQSVSRNGKQQMTFSD